MKYLCSLILIVVCLTIVKAADPPCEVSGVSIPVGESRPGLVGDCAQYTCEGVGRISGLTCPASVNQDPNYVEVEDKSKVYPDCCPRYVLRT